MVRRLRLISGLVLFTYVLTHLLNLALGLLSFEALEAGREIFVSFWRALPLTLLLYGSLLVHLRWPTTPSSGATACSPCRRQRRCATPSVC